MYNEMQKCMFAGATKLCVAADSSQYSGEKTGVSILWSPERRVACYLPVQVISQSSLFSPTDGDMSDRLRQLALNRKLTRVAAYREWQAGVRMQMGASPTSSPHRNFEVLPHKAHLCFRSCHSALILL